MEKRTRETYLTYFLSYVAHRAKRLSKGQKLSNQSVLIGANTACRLCSAMDDERKRKRGRKEREVDDESSACSAYLNLVSTVFVLSYNQTSRDEVRGFSLAPRDFRDNRISD